MSRLYYNRVASVEIGEPGKTGLLLRGLRFSFSITKTLTSDGNRCDLEINNLSRDTQNKIKETNEVTNLLVINAGYEELHGEETLFVGKITKVNHSNLRSEITTKITAEDGRQNLTEKFSTLSFESDISLKNILQTGIDDMGLTFKDDNILASIPEIISNNGFSFQGGTSKLIDNLSKELNFDWSVQNNELKILPKGQADIRGVAVKLSPETGLIDAPQRVYEEDKQEGNRFTGWDIRSFLQPRIEPGCTVEVNSSEIQEGAQFKAVQVEHIGDTHGEDWITKTRLEDLT